MAFEHGKSYNLTSASTHIKDYMAAIYTHVNGTSTLWQVEKETRTGRAIGWIEADSTAGGFTVGDTITIGASTLTAVNTSSTGPLSTDEFDISSGTNEGVAESIRIALNNQSNSFTAIVTARRFVDHPADDHAAGTATSQLGSATVNAAGGGYVVGDIVRVGTTGRYDPATFKVTSVNAGGGVTGLEIGHRGNWSVSPSTTGAPTVSCSGSGTGLTLNLVLDGQAFVDLDAVANGTTGNSVTMNVSETNAGSYLLNGNTGGPHNLFGGVAGAAAGSQSIVLRPNPDADQEILIRNVYPQNTQHPAVAIVAVNPDGSSDPWLHPENNIDNNGTFDAQSGGWLKPANQSGTFTWSCPSAGTGAGPVFNPTSGGMHRCEVMWVGPDTTAPSVVYPLGFVAFEPNLEFLWLEYPDALFWSTKDTSRLVFPTSWHAGKILEPINSTDTASPATGQRNTGHGVIGATIWYQNYTSGTSGTYMFNDSVAGYGTSQWGNGTRIRVGLGGGNQAGVLRYSPDVGISTVVQGTSWMANPYTPDQIGYTTNSPATFRFGRNNELRPKNVVLFSTSEHQALGTYKYVKSLPPTYPYSKYQSGGTEHYLYVSRENQNCVFGFNIEDGFNPKP